MAHKSAPVFSDRAIESDRHTSTVAVGNLFDNWYAERCSTVWLCINVFAVAAYVIIVRHAVEPAVLIAWSVFTLTNSVLVSSIAHGKPDLLHVAHERSPYIWMGLGAAFGAAWGITPFLPGIIHLDNLLVPVAMIAGALATFAIPVFAMHIAAYPIFLLTVTTLFALSIGRNTDPIAPLLWTFAIAGLLFYISAIYARNVRILFSTLKGMARVACGRQPTSTAEIAPYLKSSVRKLNELSRERERVTSTLNAIGEAVITTNESGKIDYLNPIAEIMTGTELEDARGRNLEEILNIYNQFSENLSEDIVQRCLESGKFQSSGEHTRIMRNDGVEYDIEFHASVIRDSSQKITGVSCYLRDVTARNHLQKSVEWNTTHDPLTQLINRTEFERRIRKLLSSEVTHADTRHAICYVDFDQFKFLNETHGVEGGNYLLKAIADELKQKIRGADTLARIGEDKFGVLLYSCPIDKARLIAEGLRRLVEDFQADWEGTEITFSVSIGVNEIDPTRDSLSDVISGAEAACEYAKRDSGNRIHVFYSSDQTQIHRSNSIQRLRDIQSAIRLNRFELYFQHIHSIRGDEHLPASCELLLRMHDENGELLAPRDFLLTAERFQLMPELDRWVVKAAVDALRVEHPALLDMQTIYINVSGQSLNDDRFLDFVLELLDEDFSNERICFAISEASLISSVERARYFIATLKELGCRVALDDFGMGINSFELLKRLQVDFLKISADFVRNMAYSSVDYEIVLALSRIAKTLRVKTIAQGVTTLATKDSLLGMGVDYVQGFLVDQPRPVAHGQIIVD